jgi:CRP/FNR family transcriptional regulator, cyclic AMP receptor protein
MATSGDILLAIREDFYMATDILCAGELGRGVLWGPAWSCYSPGGSRQGYRQGFGRLAGLVSVVVDSDLYPTEGVWCPSPRCDVSSTTITAVSDMLALSTHLPEVVLDSGQVVVHEGSSGGAIWVLVSGALQVRKGDMRVNTVTRPGALVGEISVLLGTEYGATVETTEPSRLRYAADGRALLGDPAVTGLVAVGLAERLNFVTSYLADLKYQYGDAPGLSMVSDVLTRLAQRQQPVARPGSARDPDPDY